MRKTWFRVVVAFDRVYEYLRQVTREIWLRIVLVFHRAREHLRRIVHKRRLKVAVILALILSPIALGWVYRQITAFPEGITIPEGPERGRHELIAQSLRNEIEDRFGVNTDRKVCTDGSFENLRLLQEGQIDFAIYQAGTEEALTEEALGGLQSFFRNRDKDGNGKLDPGDFTAKPPGFGGTWSTQNAEKAFNRLDKDEDGFLSLNEYSDTFSIRCVANLYSDVVHFFVRRGAGIESPNDLRGKRVALGVKTSGDYGMSLILLKHFGLDEQQSIKAEYLKYPEIEEKFEAGELDAAFITMGIKQPIFPELFEKEKCDLLSIPYPESLTTKHLSMSQRKIPAGHYRSRTPPRPATDIQTVAVNALLLTRSDVHAGLVEEVTRLVLSEDFLKEHKLRELFDRGHEFAREKTEFPIHDGAQSFYEPELKPLLPSEFVGSIEAMRQFAGSLLIAAFFAVRWLRQKRLKKKEHKLDRFIHKLLDIEQEQIALGTSGHAEDVERLQKLVADVTSLRQDALREFSARELNEDRAPECFIDMAHDLNSKIDAKISRQRLDKRFVELAEAISAQNKPTTD